MNEVREMNELTYRQRGDYLLPELSMDGLEMQTLGKYGLLRRRYLKENRPGMFNRLVLRGTLFSHLLEVEDRANEMLESMMPALAKTAGATEDLKARNMMEWVGLMNSCKAQAEEIILAELIYS